VSLLLGTGISVILAPTARCRAPCSQLQPLRRRAASRSARPAQRACSARIRRGDGAGEYLPRWKATYSIQGNLRRYAAADQLAVMTRKLPWICPPDQAWRALGRVVVSPGVDIHSGPASVQPVIGLPRSDEVRSSAEPTPVVGGVAAAAHAGIGWLPADSVVARNARTCGVSCRRKSPCHRRPPPASPTPRSTATPTPLPPQLLPRLCQPRPPLCRRRRPRRPARSRPAGSFWASQTRHRQGQCTRPTGRQNVQAVWVIRAASPTTATRTPAGRRAGLPSDHDRHDARPLRDGSTTFR
jgi:hypothetical protein